MPDRSFTFGTFYHRDRARPNKAPILRHVTAYSLYYNPLWGGCIEYTVDAKDVKAARRKARELRLQHERAQWRGSTNAQ